MSNYNYIEKILDVENHINSGHYMEACWACGLVYEQYFKDLHEEILIKSDEGEKLILDEKRQDVCYKKKVNKFTLGELVRFYHKAELASMAGRLLGKDIRISKYLKLDKLIEIRNKTCHSGYTEPTYEETALFFVTLKILLHEVGILNDDVKNESEKECPHCGKEIGSDKLFCPHCEKSVYRICLKCGNKLENDWKVCPKCNTVSDLEIQLEKARDSIKDALKRMEYCPICFATAELEDYEEDYDANEVVRDFAHHCNCYGDIQKILLAKDINLSVSDKVKEFIDSIIFPKSSLSLIYEERVPVSKSASKFTLF